MVTSVSTTTTASCKNSYSPAAAAEKVLRSLLESKEMLDALVLQSSAYVPPTPGKVISTLWAMLNTKGGVTLTQSEVKFAVFSVGKGSTNDVNSFWKQLNPDKKSMITAGEFAFSKYLRDTIAPMMDSLTEKVNEARQKSAGDSGSGGMLDYFV